MISKEQKNKWRKELCGLLEKMEQDDRWGNDKKVQERVEQLGRRLSGIITDKKKNGDTPKEINKKTIPQIKGRGTQP